MRVPVKQRHRAGVVKFGAGAVVLAVALVGCASGPSSSGGSGEDASLQNIVKRGVLNVGVCLTMPPWGSIGTDGNPKGFDVDTANQLAKYLGVEKAKIDEVTGPGRVPALQSGKDDVMMCTFTINPDRQKQVDFSNPTLAAGDSLVVMKGSPIKSIADLSGHTVGVTKGGTAQALVPQENPKAKLQYYDVVSSVFLALKQGQVDAVVEASDSVKAQANTNPDFAIISDGDFGPKSYYALGVKKGNQALLKKVNDFVAQFHSSGADVSLFTKWFLYPPTFQFTDLKITVNPSGAPSSPPETPLPTKS